MLASRAFGSGQVPSCPGLMVLSPLQLSWQHQYTLQDPESHGFTTGSTSHSGWGCLSTLRECEWTSHIRWIPQTSELRKHTEVFEGVGQTALCCEKNTLEEDGDSWKSWEKVFLSIQAAWKASGDRTNSNVWEETHVSFPKYRHVTDMRVLTCVHLWREWERAGREQNSWHGCDIQVGLVFTGNPHWRVLNVGIADIWKWKCLPNTYELWHHGECWNCRRQGL